MEALEGRTVAAESDIVALAHNSSLALQQLAASAVKSGAQLDSLTEQLDALDGRLGQGLGGVGVKTMVQRENQSELPLPLSSPMPRNVPGEHGEQGTVNSRPIPRRSSSIPLPVSPQRTSGRQITTSITPTQTNTNADISSDASSPVVATVVYSDVTTDSISHPTIPGSSTSVQGRSPQMAMTMEAQAVSDDEAGDEGQEEEEEEDWEEVEDDDDDDDDDEEDDEEEEEEEEQQQQQQRDRNYSEMESRGRRGVDSRTMGAPRDVSMSDENHAPALNHATNTNAMVSSPSSVGTPRRRSPRRFRSRSRDPLSPLHGNTSYRAAGLAREPSLDDDGDDDLEGADDETNSSDSGTSVTEVHHEMEDVFRATLRPNAGDANDLNNQGLGRVTFTLTDLAGLDSMGEQSQHHDKGSMQMTTPTMAVSRDHNLYNDEDDDDACSDLNASEHDDKGLDQKTTRPAVTTKGKQSRRLNKDKELSATNKKGISKMPPSYHQMPPSAPVSQLRPSQKENDEMLSHFDAARRKRYVYERYVGRTFTDGRVSDETKGRAHQHQPFRTCVINGIVRLEGHAHLFFVYYDLLMNPRGPPPRSDPRYQ